MKKKTTSLRRSNQGLYLVALFEGAKGILVLLAGFGLLSLIHRNVHDIAAQIIQQFHINPAHHYPRIFLDLTEQITDTNLWAMAVAAALYAIIRIVEAVGLWMHRIWAEWFGVVSGGLYIPVEIYEISRGVTWAKFVVLLVNIAIVGILVITLLKENYRK